MIGAFCLPAAREARRLELRLASELRPLAAGLEFRPEVPRCHSQMAGPTASSTAASTSGVAVRPASEWKKLIRKRQPKGRICGRSSWIVLIQSMTSLYHCGLYEEPA